MISITYHSLYVLQHDIDLFPVILTTGGDCKFEIIHTDFPEKVDCGIYRILVQDFFYKHSVYHGRMVEFEDVAFHQIAVPLCCMPKQSEYYREINAILRDYGIPEK